MKSKISEILYNIFIGIIRFITFVLNLIMHPILNISFWLIPMVFYLYSCNDNYRLIICDFEIDTDHMFLTAAGLISILSFITNYLQSETVDDDSKESYYLGYNVRKLLYYDNFWFKQFNLFSVRFFYWSILIVPSLLILSKFRIDINFIAGIAKIISNNKEILKILWLSMLTIALIYCFAIFIETIHISKTYFSLKSIYRSTNFLEEETIKKKIRKNTNKVLDRLFRFNNILSIRSEFSDKVDNYVSHALIRGSVVNNDIKGYIKYIKLITETEVDRVDELADKILHINSSYEKTKLKPVRFIKGQILSLYMDKLSLYYKNKWNVINYRCKENKIFMFLAIGDLNKLNYIENKLSEAYAYKKYFWGICDCYQYNKFKSVETKSNICTSKIIHLFLFRINSKKFLNDIEFIDFYKFLEAIKDFENKYMDIAGAKYKHLSLIINNRNVKERVNNLPEEYKDKLRNDFPEYDDLIKSVE